MNKIFLLFLFFCISGVSQEDKCQINITIVYDIPPEDEEDTRIYIINNGSSIQIKNNDIIKPGKYKLLIEKEGYAFAGIKEIVIQPGQKKYNINEHLTKKSYKLQWGIFFKNEQNEIVYPNEIINSKTGKEFSLKELKEFNSDFIFIFKKYRTICISSEKFLNSKIELPTLQNLSFYDICLPHNELTLDGIYYFCTFYIDNKKLEEYRIEKIKDAVYRIWAEPEAIKLRLCVGFFETETELKNINIECWKKINGKKLIKHLEKLKNKEKNIIVIIDIIENLLNNQKYFQLIKKQELSEKKVLLDYLERLKFEDAISIFRAKQIFEKLKENISNSSQE